MAKIYDLPTLEDPDGTETVPVVRGGVTFRARIAGLMKSAVDSAIGPLTTMVKPDAPAGYAGGLRDSLGRSFLVIGLDGLIKIGRARISNLTTTMLTVPGSAIAGAAPSGFLQVWRDPLGRALAGIKYSGAFAVANLVGVKSINGVVISTILAPRGAVTAAKPVMDAEINLFVWYGQSKPTGADSVPSLTGAALYDGLSFNDGVRRDGVSAPARSSFAPLIERTNGNAGETPASGMDAALKQRISADYGIAPADRPYQMLMSCAAVGGTPIDGLKVGSTPHNWIKADFDAMRSIAQASGKSSKFRAFSWSQGESDYMNATAANLYRSQLVAIRVNLDTYVKAANPTNGDVLCFVDQVFAHATYGFANNPYLALEQFAICRAEYGFIMVGNLAHLPNSGYPHWTNKGSQWAGCYYARAYQRVVIEKGIWKPLAPVDAYRDGKVIMVRFEPESGEIKFDTASVPEQGSKGFSLVDDVGAAIAITSVERVGKDMVKIVAASAVPAGAKIRTGFGNGGHTNIRDTMGDTVQMAVGTNTYVMHNWCLITSTTLA